MRLINLLQRFYLPDEGDIFIDGINIKDFDIHYLRSKYGAVGQEPLLINDTIGEFMRYGCPLPRRLRYLRLAKGLMRSSLS